MADREVFRLNSKWSLGFDRAQWIVRKLNKKANKHGVRDWKSLSFIGSNKDILWRALGEHGVVVTPEARAAIDAMPYRFLDWLAEHDAGVADDDAAPAPAQEAA